MPSLPTQTQSPPTENFLATVLPCTLSKTFCYKSAPFHQRGIPSQKLAVKTATVSTGCASHQGTNLQMVFH